MEKATIEKLQELKEKDQIVLLVFSAKWHDRSQKVISFLDSLNINPKYISVLCADIDELMEVTLEYSVRFLPWCILMRKGDVMESTRFIDTTDELVNFLGEDLYEMAVEN